MGGTCWIAFTIFPGHTWFQVIALMLACCCCCAILIQDIRSRLIHILPVAALGASGLAFHFPDLGLAWLIDRGTGLLLLLVVFAGMAMVMRLRRPGTPLVDGLIGLGDLVLLPMVLTWLPASGMLFFFTSGVILALLVTLLAGRLKTNAESYPVPLAGILAGYLILFFPVYSLWLSSFLEQMLLPKP